MSIKLYDLPDSDKKIYFVEENIDGKNYGSQTGGCACNHPTITGFLHEFVSNDKSINSFNPDWWYNRVYREAGTLDSKIADEIEFEGIKWEQAWDLYKDIKFDRRRASKRKQGEDFWGFSKRENKWMEENCPEYHRANQINKKLEELIPQHPDFITWDKLKVLVQNDLNKIKPLDVSKVEIIKDFGGGESEEAWVFVRVTYSGKQSKMGIISWDNCD